MIRGIYTAASGMLAETTRADTIANNLANGSTAGYKKDVAISKDFANVLIQRINDGPEPQTIGGMGVGTLIDEIATIQSPGSLRFSGNTFDFAIDGKGFFAIQTAAGVRYTRNGTFTRNARGELVTFDGDRVVGQNGPITLPDGKATVDNAGNITVNGANVGQLRVVEFQDERQLVKEGANLYRADNAGRQATGKVQQGLLEQSNVNVVSEMVNLITGYRAYELNAKTVQTHDQLLDKAVNEVGKV